MTLSTDNTKRFSINAINLPNPIMWEIEEDGRSVQQVALDLQRQGKNISPKGWEALERVVHTSKSGVKHHVAFIHLGLVDEEGRDYLKVRRQVLEQASLQELPVIAGLLLAENSPWKNSMPVRRYSAAGCYTSPARKTFE